MEEEIKCTVHGIKCTVHGCGAMLQNDDILFCRWHRQNWRLFCEGVGLDEFIHDSTVDKFLIAYQTNLAKNITSESG